MNILVIGRSGQLATELPRAAWPRDARVTALGRGTLDLTDRAAVDRAVAAMRPDLLVNAAGYTAVDRAEAEPDAAFAVNAGGAETLARLAHRHDIPLIHVSTDYVFGAAGGRPWREDDAPAPQGVYARSKLAGEQAVQSLAPRHVILRTSWLFAAHGQNFVRTMLRLGAARDRIGVVDDQIGCPTAAADLARVIAAVAGALLRGGGPSGVYHYAGDGAVSWHGFATTIFDLAGDLVPQRPRLDAITTADYGAAAPRPAYSVLDCGKIERDFGIARAPWIAGLRSVLDELRRG